MAESLKLPHITGVKSTIEGSPSGQVNQVGSAHTIYTPVNEHVAEWRRRYPFLTDSPVTILEILPESMRSIIPKG